MNKPVRHEQALYRTIDQIMSETNLCRGTVMKIAEDADAVLRIGRAVRINAEKFYKYFELIYRC